MGKLIDADELIEIIEGNENLIDWEKEECISCVAACDTAYDVDAVVSELEHQAEQYHNRAEKYAVAGVTHEIEHMAGKAASYEHAIEIVKGGGVDD